MPSPVSRASMTLPASGSAQDSFPMSSRLVDTRIFFPPQWTELGFDLKKEKKNKTVVHDDT